MNRLVVAGSLLVLVGLGGYGLGTTTAYPGRSFSVTAFMLGITLLASKGAEGDT